MSEGEAATLAVCKEIGDGLSIWRDSKNLFWQVRAYVPGTRRHVR